MILQTKNELELVCFVTWVGFIQLDPRSPSYKADFLYKMANKEQWLENEIIEEVDTRGEDDDYIYYETMEQKLEQEAAKLGQPWNRPVNISDPKADEKIAKAGEDARKLEAIRTRLAEIRKST